VCIDSVLVFLEVYTPWTGVEIRVFGVSVTGQGLWPCPMGLNCFLWPQFMTIEQAKELISSCIEQMQAQYKSRFR
jgi:hypothetical protein